MNCKNCGAEINEGTVFCGNCGMKIEKEQPVYEGPVFQHEVHTEYQEQGSYIPPVIPAEPVIHAETVVSAEKPNTVFWIILSALEIFLCCPLTGIISLIFSIIGHVSADKGDFEDAAKKIKIAKVIFWIGFAIGLLFIIAFAFIFVLGFLTGLTDEVIYY